MTSLLGLLFLIAGGCAGGSADPSAPGRQWLRAHGGLDRGDGVGRARTVLARLTAHCHGRNLGVAVLNSADVSAFAWPDGSLFVTRGLLDLLDDEELAAALAHELGHLLSDGHLSSPASLRGQATDGDHQSEAVADAIGCALLRTAGLPPEAMGRMLSKVQSRVTLARAEALEVRIQKLGSKGAEPGGANRKSG